MKTEILDKEKGKMVKAEIVEQPSKSILLKTVKLLYKEKEIGRMIYNLSHDHLYIQMVHNDQQSRFARVGTVLVNYAFDESLRNGKGGRIEFSPVPASLEFWIKLGFEFKSKNGTEMKLPEGKIQVMQNSEERKLRAAESWAEKSGFAFKKFDK
jgi:hypothetical protein